MSNKNEQSFEYYELIPRDETLRRPVPDKYAHLNSKPYTNTVIQQQIQNQGQNPSTKEKIDYENLIRQKEVIVNSLKIDIQNVSNKLKQQTNNKMTLLSILNQIKLVLNLPYIQNEKLVEQIKRTLQLKNVNNIELLSNPMIEANLQNILAIKQSQIRHLKQQLLESTANNINAIFQIQLNSQSINRRQIEDLRNQFQKASVGKQGGPLQWKNEQKILNLIKKYDEMLHIYHANEKCIQELKIKQQDNFAYFSSAKADITHSVFKACNQYTNQKLKVLQNQIRSIIQSISNQPEKVKIDQQQNSSVRELLTQVENLNQRITQRQIQIQKMRSANQQLMVKSRAYQSIQKQAEKLKNVELKLKEKDKRIQQLQNTIIDHMDSRAKDDSLTSQDSDVEKQKLTIRNLKALNLSLKNQNMSLKTKLSQSQSENRELRIKISNLTTDSADKIQIVEKVSKDEAPLKIAQTIVETLIDSKIPQEKCKCLESITECLLNLNDEYPELEGVLQQLGLIQKTLNLLPID